MKLTELCRELKNWFDKDRIFDTFTIEGGVLTIPAAKDGQYFRIVGSVFNDGVYQYPVNNLTDETFKGAVWLMAVPKDVLDKVNEITAWETANAGAINSPYTSESFGGYSYSKSSGGDGSGASSASWQGHFASWLNKYRKI